jgi:hypothetical protein
VGTGEASAQEAHLSVGAGEIVRGYLLALLCLPRNGLVLASLTVSGSPLDRAKRYHRRRPHPQYMLYAEMGSMGRARRGLSWVRREMLAKWPAQDGWISVPKDEGRAFYRLVLESAHRYSALEANNSLHYIDIKDLSDNYASMHHRNDPPHSAGGCAPRTASTI